MLGKATLVLDWKSWHNHGSISPLTCLPLVTRWLKRMKNIFPSKDFQKHTCVGVINKSTCWTSSSTRKKDLMRWKLGAATISGHLLAVNLVMIENFHTIVTIIIHIIVIIVTINIHTNGKSWEDAHPEVSDQTIELFEPPPPKTWRLPLSMMTMFMVTVQTIFTSEQHLHGGISVWQRWSVFPKWASPLTSEGTPGWRGVLYIQFGTEADHDDSCEVILEIMINHTLQHVIPHREGDDHWRNSNCGRRISLAERGGCAWWGLWSWWCRGGEWWCW